jgi:hypothetical protein
MATKFFQQKTVTATHSVRYVHSFSINLSMEKIDLYQWVTGMTDTDYQSYATAHKAMGSYTRDGVFIMTNVENIGNETIFQRYELKYHSPYHVQFYSPASTAYVLRWFPVRVGVPWEMVLRPVSPGRCELICLIGADFPNGFVKAMAWMNGLGGFFLKRHLKREGRAFARDIEGKFNKA